MPVGGAEEYPSCMIKAGEGGLSKMENGRKRVTVTLPESLVTQARAEGLLTSENLERLLREEMRRRNLKEFGDLLKRLHALKVPPMTEEELAEEIRAARRERRTGNAARS